MTVEAGLQVAGQTFAGPGVAWQEPAGMADGTNMYVCVGNDPVNEVDPSGRHPIWWKAYQRCSAKFNLCSAVAYKEYIEMLGICTAAGVVSGAAAGLITSFFLTPIGGAITAAAAGFIGSGVCEIAAKSDYKKALGKCDSQYFICMKSVGLNGLLLHPL